MTQKVTVELDYDTVDSIVIQEMNNAIKFFQNDLEARKNGRTSHGFFSIIPEVDITELENHILAFETVLNYYDPPWIRKNRK